MRPRYFRSVWAGCWMPLAALLAGSTALAQSGNLPPEILNYADTVYINAKIITLDEHEMNPDPGTIARAMAVRDEMILALGNDRDMLALAGPETRVVDLKGKTVDSGFR